MSSWHWRPTDIPTVVFCMEFRAVVWAQQEHFPQSHFDTVIQNGRNNRVASDARSNPLWLDQSSVVVYYIAVQWASLPLELPPWIQTISITFRFSMSTLCLTGCQYFTLTTGQEKGHFIFHLLCFLPTRTLQRMRWWPLIFQFRSPSTAALLVCWFLLAKLWPYRILWWLTVFADIWSYWMNM